MKTLSVPPGCPSFDKVLITLWGVLAEGRRCSRRRRRRIQSPVQVSPELLLVLSMDQFIDTLVHHVSLRKTTRGGRESAKKEERDVQDVDKTEHLD